MQSQPQSQSQSQSHSQSPGRSEGHRSLALQATPVQFGVSPIRKYDDKGSPSGYIGGEGEGVGGAGLGTKRLDYFGANSSLRSTRRDYAAPDNSSSWAQRGRNSDPEEPSSPIEADDYY